MKILDYDLTRSKRKSVAIIIKEGKVFVKAPINTQKSYIDSFVQSKQSWIHNKLTSYENLSLKLNKFISYECYSFFGTEFYPLITDKIKSIQLDIASKLLLIPIKYALEPKEKLLKAIKNFYRKTAYNYFKDKLSNFEHTFLNYKGFTLTNAYSKWGSCSVKNEIRLNFKLIMLEEKFSNYVIIHELCHTIEHNHSKRFWNNVQKYLPEYKIVRQELKAKNIFIKLFS